MKLVRRMWWLGVVVVLAIGGLWWLRDGRTPSARTAIVLPMAPTRVVAQAQIVPIEGIIEVRPLSEGRVLRVLVHPGERVASGQLLAEIESDIQSAALQAREAEALAARERLRTVQEGVRAEDRAALVAAAEAAKHEADMARDRLDRQQQLFNQGFVSEQIVVEARQSLAAAQARAREAQMRAQAGIVGGRPSEVRAAREQVSAANAVRDAEKIQLERTRIVAPITGMVMTRNVNPGDIIGPNVTAPTLFRIVDPTRVEVRLEVEELLATQVAIGQPVRFMLPGTQQEIGTGRLIRIAPQVERRTIGADDARLRADSMVRPAWSEFTASAGGSVPPINFRLEAWVTPR